jgi:hypothetical protein
MKQDYLTRINSFTIDNLPDIDEVVLGSLQFLSASDIPKLDSAFGLRYYEGITGY